MIPRIFAIAAILFGTSVAWFILGGTINSRTHSSDGSLREKVVSVWGAPQIQLAPSAVFGANAGSPVASNIQVGLRLQHRRKGLMWYSTYASEFQGDYDFRNADAEAHDVQLWWAFPAKGSVYDDLQLTLDGVAVFPQISDSRVLVAARLGPGQTVRMGVHYRSQGLDSWKYAFGKEIQALPNFHLRVNTDFHEVDFEENTLAPTQKRETEQGWQLDWTYRSLFAGREISVVMPQRAQPGPLAAQISFFAPVSLSFFFFVMVMLAARRNVDLHPMHYFFLACSFFAFHLLLAYSVDHIDIYLAFAISAAVSISLVVSYLRSVTGAQFAVREAAMAQFVYLVLFSFAFFFDGFTGLTIAVGAILTLFVAMQMTAAVQWDSVFRTEAEKNNPPAIV